jgi:hypothetical protein
VLLDDPLGVPERTLMVIRTLMVVRNLMVANDYPEDAISDNMGVVTI